MRIQMSGRENRVKLAAAFLSGIAAISICAWSQPPADSESEKPFLGRWDLTLEAPDREYPSWLELSERDGQLKAQMVGRWGNARPLTKAEISNSRLTFVSPKDEEAAQADMVFEGTLADGRLSGTVNGPDGRTW